MTLPSEIKIPVFYPNDYTQDGAGMNQRDYDDGQIGSDNLRTIRELLDMPTFNRLAKEFQRCYIAMCVAAWEEAGLLCGVGTGWRSYEVQLKNWQENPKQFSNPIYSLHVNKGYLDVDDVAYAIDTVPYDVLKWAHKNCDRFNIAYLAHIPHELHHCQPKVIPYSGSAFNKDPQKWTLLVSQKVNLPYLGMQEVDEWLSYNLPISIVPKVPKPQVPDLEEPEMRLARNKNNKYELRRGDGNVAVILRSNEYVKLATATPNELASYRFVNPYTGELITHPDQVPVIDETELDLRIGYPARILHVEDEG